MQNDNHKTNLLSAQPKSSGTVISLDWNLEVSCSNVFCVSRVFARSFRNKKLSTHGSVLSCPHLKRFIYAAAPCVNTRRAVELTGALPPAPLPTSVINTFVIRLTRQFHEDCCCSAADQPTWIWDLFFNINNILKAYLCRLHDFPMKVAYY